MSASPDPQRKAFEFLLRKYRGQEPFLKEEFRTATGWSDASFKTYWSKQFKGLFLPLGDSFRIHGVFGQYTNWVKFRDNVVTQNRKLAKDYQPSSFTSVIIFEFFMPLRNEEYLRTALDALFFKDSVVAGLNSAHEKALHKQYPKLQGESKDHYFERLCAWISEKFVGYSIHHVNGRFRVAALRTQEEVAKAQGRTAERYLVDETTAVVRFIIPCGAVAQRPFAPGAPLLGQSELEGSTDPTIAKRVQEALELEANQIRWFFTQLFVQRILEVVAGEDEIWLLESGMRNELHIWRGLG